MTPKTLTAAILCSFLLNFSIAQENRKQNIDWGEIREAFKAYCAFPSVDNANKILSVVPKEFDKRNADLKQWSSTLDYIWFGDPYIVLRNLVQNGDKFAIRVAFRTLVISDSGFAESLCSLIGDSIRVNPAVFLEEAKIFIEYTQDSEIMLSTVFPDYYPSFSIEAFKKEIQMRIKSLETVTRPDLLNIRDNCISKLKEELRFSDSK